MRPALARRHKVSSLTSAPPAETLPLKSTGIKMKKLILIAALLAPTAGALADTGSTGANAKRNTQMVCRPIKETGSRLSKKRICMTREEWAEQKRIMRSDLDRAQTRRMEPQGN
jgi:hypothetical protein